MNDTTRVERATQRCMEVVDQEGAVLSRAQWLELLQAIVSECGTRVVASREDQAREDQKYKQFEPKRTGKRRTLK